MTKHFAALALLLALLLACLAIPAGAMQKPPAGYVPEEPFFKAVPAEEQAVEAAPAAGPTIEDMFSGCKGGPLGNLKLKLEGDTAIFTYSPVFYVQRAWSSTIDTYEGGVPEELLEEIERDLEDGVITWEEAWVRHQALWAQYPVTWISEIVNYTLSDEEVQSVIDACVAGIKRWEGDYEVRGRTLTLVINVDAKLADEEPGSNFRIVSGDDLYNTAGDANFTAIVWRPNFITKIGIYPDDPRDDWYCERVSAHEFGHAMGLNDAYGYTDHNDPSTWFGRLGNVVWGFIQPEAPPENAPRDAIMRGSWLGAVIYDRDAEMVLWAWKHGKFQLYAKSIARVLFFWFEYSPVFTQ